MSASKLSSKKCVGGASLALPARRTARAGRPGAVGVKAAAAGGYVPDMNRRNVMNLLLVGAAGLPAATMAGAFAWFFYPASSGGGGGGLTAKDALGNDVTSKGWLATHQPGDHSLTQGLKGDPTYLVVTTENKIENYGINAVCTHLGCVVPWNVPEQKFKCPCHGSQYNAQGRVVRGPAPLSLALAHAEIDADDKVVFTPWTETDFRTGLDPWWK
ncbi:rieske iron-sulfur subunit of chloroplast cytochrome b6-f complex [Chloropicon primus]|nr:rieske iron-sulfur subunit of chloroplast cytochrome b6-f complex [Chloropicon primus]UPQ96947.1 rieske iron-sulfur subunit of chloroplast cytochrome b6-f complex [Chloropicon primus]|eukprot:QDZ17729.1 rieske iron-sulfur subunit of chloroplast cytochrome b6-f complex [Chloropicon primus]